MAWWVVFLSYVAYFFFLILLYIFSRMYVIKCPLWIDIVAMVSIVELDSHSSAPKPHSPGSGISFTSLDIAAGVCEVPDSPVQVEVCFSLTLPS